jgi:formylglycine-generating enzyme required for sulfatase activity
MNVAELGHYVMLAGMVLCDIIRLFISILRELLGMAKFFVSYARIDVVLAEQIIEVLRQRYGHANVWYDQELHNRGGENWWEEILDAIDEADIFVYLLSKESVESPYCQAEFIEAQRLQKRLIFIQVRDRTPLPDMIASRQYADMSKGINNLKIWTSLYNSIEHQISKIPKRRPRPLTPERTPRPEQSESSQVRPNDAPAETTPKLEPVMPVPTNGDGGWKQQIVIGIIVTVIGGLILSFLLGQFNGGDGASETGGENPVPTTAVAQQPTEAPTIDETDDSEDTNDVGTAFLPSETPEPTQTPTSMPTETPTNISTLTNTPDVVEAAQQVLQQQTAQAIIEQATATSARATQEESLQRTQDANLTATATLWTPTPTPNLTATIDRILTQWAEETATQQSVDATATATLWTLTPTNTPTATLTPTNTPTNTPLPTLSPLEEALQRARNFTGTQNSDWVPIEADFDGVTMVLVPAGCFMMGNDSNSYGGDSNGGQQCFDEPFWIDKYEVTQADFERLGGEQSDPPDFEGANRPVEDITWFEARDFCALRNAQLPTEAQWEYVARGVEALYFPWGNDWDSSKVIWNRSSSQGTAEVGSILAGASWVGALDMSGNVWEWTRSVYEDYPYVATDGREADLGGETDVRYSLRGGSWLGSNDGVLRSASRLRYDPNNWNFDGGFRCFLSYE